MKPDVIDDIMTIKVAKIEEDKTLKEAEDMIQAWQVRKLVVTRQEKPIFILVESNIWGKDRIKSIKESFKEEELKKVVTVPTGTIIDDEVRQKLAENPAIVIMDRQNKDIEGVVTATDLRHLVDRRLQKAQWQR